MARKERDTVGAKGKGATPRKETIKRGFKFRAIIAWPKFGASKFRALKTVNWRLVLGSSVMGLAIILASIYWDDVVNEFDHKVTSIEVKGRVNYLKPKVLREQFNQYLGDGFISLNLDMVKESVEAMPWVYSASLQRKWPGTLVIYIKEQYPAAIWNKKFYLNAYGDVFKPSEVFSIDGVPELFGPPEHEKEMLRRFVKYRGLLESTGAVVSELSLEPRGAWQVTLKSGVSIKLGRDPVDTKLNRFIKAYQQGLKNQTEEIESIDARYTNGIAVRWKEQT